MYVFDFKGIPAHVKGTNDISRTSFRVPSDESLEYWVKRFIHFKVNHQAIKEQFGKKVLYFEDFDKQQYALFSDENNQGIQSGEKLRISNKGYDDGNGNRGDLVAEIKIVVPKKISEQEKELYEKLEQISKFNPREEK